MYGRVSSTVRYPQEDLGAAVTFGINGTANSLDYITQGRQVALHVTADQAGTCQIFEIDNTGVLKSLGSAVAFSANAAAEGVAEIHFLTNPVPRKVRMRYVNTSGVAGTVAFRAVAS